MYGLVHVRISKLINIRVEQLYLLPLPKFITVIISLFFPEKKKQRKKTKNTLNFEKKNTF